jgi:ribosomal protein S8
MDETFLVTFIFDIEISIKKQSNLYYGISKTIRKKLKYRDDRAKYIFYKYSVSLPESSKNNVYRVYITYEMEKENSNLFIYKAKENPGFIFKTKENSYVSMQHIKLVNEELDISYHAGYWTHFPYISDSPRTDSCGYSSPLPSPK